MTYLQHVMNQLENILYNSQYSNITKESIIISLKNVVDTYNTVVEEKRIKYTL
jgi:hypothetical protein